MVWHLSSIVTQVENFSLIHHISLFEHHFNTHADKLINLQTTLGELYSSWLLYAPWRVHWELFPRQTLRVLGMFLVVAFGSSLDVAAVEMELGLPLDYNKYVHTTDLSSISLTAEGVIHVTD